MFIHSPADGHLGYFWFWVITKTSHYKHFLCEHEFVLYLEMGLLRDMIDLVEALLGLPPLLLFGLQPAGPEGLSIQTARDTCPSHPCAGPACLPPTDPLDMFHTRDCQLQACAAGSVLYKGGRG